jgi:hypothetical protein
MSRSTGEVSWPHPAVAVRSAPIGRRSRGFFRRWPRKLTHRFCGSTVRLDLGLRVHLDGQAGIGVAHPGLGHIDIHALGHQTRGGGPS